MIYKNTTKTWHQCDKRKLCQTDHINGHLEAPVKDLHEYIYSEVLHLLLEYTNTKMYKMSEQVKKKKKIKILPNQDTYNWSKNP